MSQPYVGVRSDKEEEEEENMGEATRSSKSMRAAGSSETTDIEQS
jgi:hypothetical protein